jgi:hypothetical protein
MPEQKPNHQNRSRNEVRQQAAARDRADDRLKRPADREEELLNEAEEAVNAMEMREMRRSGSYRTGGDDLNAGIDTDIDSNAPTDTQVSGTRGGGSRGKSDGR